MSSHGECSVTGYSYRRADRTRSGIAALWTIDHHAQKVVMDVEYAFSDTNDVLYGIMTLK
jgi:hypothetical protein